MNAYSRVGILLLFQFLAGTSLAADHHEKDPKKTHLFILSGQSNMAGLKPERTFTPAVTEAFEGDDIIVVKDAKGGMPIRCWDKKWEPAEERQVQGVPLEKRGELYDQLMSKVDIAIKDKKPDTITFIWMQGERDARELHGEVYAESLHRVIKQLRTDFERDDINIIIGRLSDFSVGNDRYKHWDEVRAAQEKVAEEDDRAVVIDTDEWNGENNDLHYNKEGYDELGKAFANEAVKMIKNPPKSEEKEAKPQNA